MNSYSREGRTWALNQKHWRINDIKEVAIKSYWISQKSIITGVSGFGWGNAGRKGLTLNSVMEDRTCNLSSERIMSIWKVEKIVVDREWIYCSTVLFMLFKVVCVWVLFCFFFLNKSWIMFVFHSRQCISKASKQERFPIFPMQILSSIPSLQQFASRQ